jgi:hypothetical protein
MTELIVYVLIGLLFISFRRLQRRINRQREEYYEKRSERMQRIRDNR